MMRAGAQLLYTAVDVGAFGEVAERHRTAPRFVGVTICVDDHQRRWREFHAAFADFVLRWDGRRHDDIHKTATEK